MSRVAGKAVASVKVLKGLVGVGWGQQKETLIPSLKALVLPQFNYAAPIFQPNMSTSALRKLQRVQNSVLRVAMGFHLVVAPNHLHQECKVISTYYVSNFC